MSITIAIVSSLSRVEILWFTWLGFSSLFSIIPGTPNVRAANVLAETSRGVSHTRNIVIADKYMKDLPSNTVMIFKI